MSTIKTPAQIATEVQQSAPLNANEWEMMVRAIEADRAQRQPEIYIVQGEGGDVLDMFRDRGEAEAAFAPSLDAGTASIVEETVMEPGEYAELRIAELTAEWEDAANYGRAEDEPPIRATDYTLSEDDWKTGLSDDDAREIAALIEWQEAQK